MSNTTTQPSLDSKAIRTLAQSVHREMRGAGYSSAQVVDFASTMLDLVRSQLTDEQAANDPDTATLVAE